MNNPKERQEWIYQELIKTPALSYTDCWGKYGVKWGKKENTFTSDWNKANKRFKEYQRAVNEAKMDASIKEEVKSLKRDILQKHEAQEILTKIARGTATKVDGKVVIPSANERISAVKTLAEQEGWNAPLKQSGEIIINFQE